MNLKDISGGISKFGGKFFGEFRKNSPTILSATAIVTFTASLVCVWKSKDKINADFSERKENIEKAKESKSKELEEKLIRDANIECAKNVTFHALPIAVLSTATIACIIGSLKINNRRLAMFSAAYALAEKNLDDYKKKVEEMFGKGKAEKLDQEVMKSHADEIIGNGDNIYIQNTGKGTELIMDDYSGEVFLGSITEVEAAVNEFNAALNTEAADNMLGKYNIEEFYEKDMEDLYYYLGISVGDCAKMRKWRSDKLMGLIWADKPIEKWINGENRSVKVVKFTNYIEPYYEYSDRKAFGRY